MSRKFKDWITIGTFFCVVIGCLIVIDTHFRGVPKNPPLLVAVPAPPPIGDRPPVPDGSPELRLEQPPRPIWIPLAQNTPTIVPVENHGERQALIQSVSFRILKKKPTPVRRNLVANPTAVPINFRARHYNKGTHSFDSWLSRPVSAPGGGDAVYFEVAIVDKRWAGNTYVGVFVVHYAGGKTLQVDNVELDVLSNVPTAPPKN